MKIAIVLPGYIRTWERTKESFIRAFGALNPDIYISTYNKKYGFAPYIQGLTNYYGDEDISYDQIKAMFADLNGMSIAMNDDKDFADRMAPITKKIALKYDNIESFYPQFVHLDQCLRRMEDTEQIYNFKYDYVIKTRPDLVYNDPFVFPMLSDNEVLIDRGNVFPNDVFIACKRDVMMGIKDFILNEFFLPKYPEQSGSWPPHSIVYSAFVDQNLTVLPAPIIDYVARYNYNQKY